VAAIVGTEMPRGVMLPRLREVRLRRLLTQEDLAARAGVSVATISKLEQSGSESTAALSTARKLASALGVEPEALMAPAPAD
jgi:transcriptional regulator with XRE-family HTH domain